MNILDLLFSWFTVATLRASLLTLAVLALQSAFRGRLPAQWRYALWLPVILVLGAPFLPQSRWSLENRLRPAAAAAARDNATARLLEFENKPNLPGLEWAAIPAGGAPQISWLKVAQIGWMTGSAGLLIFTVAGYGRTMRKMRRGAVPTNPALAAILAEAGRACGLKRLPALLVSRAVFSPAVTGFFRSTLLLPAEFMEVFSPAEARLVLLHELTHLKRHDLLLNWLLCLLQALHWCNPWLWFAFARIRADRESACDAQVLDAATGDCRAEYGHALLKVEGAFGHSGMSLGLVGVFERRAGVRTRILAIAGHRRAHPGWSLLGVGLIAGLVLAGGTRAQNPGVSEATPGQGSAPGLPPSGPALDRALRQKLASIVIPRLELQEATIPETLDYLVKKSVEFDPAGTGVKIQSKLTPESGTARMTITLKNVTLDIGLRYVTQLTNAKYRVENQTVVVVDANSPDPVWPILSHRWMLDATLHPRFRAMNEVNLKALLVRSGVPFPNGTAIQISADRNVMTVTNTELAFDQIDGLLATDQATDEADKLAQRTKAAGVRRIQHKLGTIVIPLVELRGVTLRAAVDFLKKKGIECDTADPDPSMRGVNFVVHPNDMPDPLITLRLTAVSLGEAVQRVCAQAKRPYEVQAYAVAIKGRLP